MRTRRPERGTPLESVTNLEINFIEVPLFERLGVFYSRTLRGFHNVQHNLIFESAE
jgi:hypothetical protein